MGQVSETMTALADEVRELSGTEGKKTIPTMTADIHNANGTIDEQSNFIDQLIELAQQKASGGGETSKTAKALIRDKAGYINTGINGANSNLTIEVRYEFLTIPSGYWNLVYAYVNETTNATRIIYNSTSYIYTCLNSSPSQSLSSAGKRYANVVYTDILQPTSSTTFSFTHNGVAVSKTRVSANALDKDIILFPSATDGVSIKLYYLKIYDGSTLVRDFVPFVNYNGECGLRDKVTNTFYGNSASSGVFTVEV